MAQHEMRLEDSRDRDDEQRVRCSCGFVGEWRDSTEELNEDGSDHPAAAGGTFGGRPRVNFLRG